MLRQRNRSLLGAAAWTLAAQALLAGPAEVTAFERIDAIVLESGEEELRSAVIDPAGAFAYVGTFTAPGRVVKIDLETFDRVDAVELESGEDRLTSAVIDPAGDFAYFGTDNSAFAGGVVKIDLETFERVDAVELASGEVVPTSAVIDPAGAFAYFGTVIGRVVKIDLETFERVDAVELESDEFLPRSAVIDPAGAFAYFGTVIGRVVKIDLETFERVDAIELESDENSPSSAVIDPHGDFAYFGTWTEPARVVKIDLETFERVDAIELESAEGGLVSAVIDSEGAFAYFGTDDTPGRVVKIGLVAFSPVALAVDTSPILSDGNGLFEPGEQVEIAPAWHNDGSFFPFLEGTASDFTGPAGPIYTLVMADADYGEVEPGEVVTCQESEMCYRMDIGPEGGERPAPHWDATFDEVLSSGTVHTWTLHMGDSFLDVPRTNLFYRFVETLLHWKVTAGCTTTEYCPMAANTRAQMAVFVLRALEGIDYVPQPCLPGAETFDDVPASSIFCRWVEELHRRDVVGGCGGGNYCPQDPVTRAQMAVFLLATLEGPGFQPPPCTGIFSDVPCPSMFANWIEELANRGITGGCSSEPPAYCPAASVNRQQMATLVGKTFGLTLYGP